MRYLSFVLALSFLSPSISSISADEKKTDDTKAADTKKVEVKEVKVKALTLKVPSTWKQEKNASSMRLATYSVPAVEGDKDRGELTIFSFGGGGGDVTSNLSRWIGQFGGEDRTAKVTKGKAGDNEYYLADISGTYNKSVGPPIQRKTVAAEGYRMLGVILILEGKGVYYLKLAGPDASIKAQADAFRESFGGAAKTEKAYEL